MGEQIMSEFKRDMTPFLEKIGIDVSTPGFEKYINHLDREEYCQEWVLRAHCLALLKEGGFLLLGLVPRKKFAGQHWHFADCIIRDNRGSEYVQSDYIYMDDLLLCKISPPIHPEAKSLEIKFAGLAQNLKEDLPGKVQDEPEKTVVEQKSKLEKLFEEDKDEDKWDDNLKIQMQEWANLEWEIKLDLSSMKREDFRIDRVKVGKKTEIGDRKFKVRDLSIYPSSFLLNLDEYHPWHDLTFIYNAGEEAEEITAIPIEEKQFWSRKTSYYFDFLPDKTDFDFISRGLRYGDEDDMDAARTPMPGSLGGAWFYGLESRYDIK